MFRAILILLCSALALAGDPIVIGRTDAGSLIEASVVPSASPRHPRVLLIGGLAGSDASSSFVLRELAWFQSLANSRRRFTLAAIPTANPTAAPLAFPPPGDAYRAAATAHFLWRWIGTWGPDLVLVIGPDPANLAATLSREKVAGVGSVPARHVEANSFVLRRLDVSKAYSSARSELERRTARTPIEVARQMSLVYGHEMEEAVYIPAVALQARLRLGERQDVERIAAPFLRGEKASLAKATGSHLAGHLLFADLAELTSDPRYTALVRAAAGLGFDPNGHMRESMPFHSQMSDSVFMGCPILVRAAKLTGDRKYLDMALRHFGFIQALDQRSDGLWRHSPQDEAAWARGNGFAILGMALSLSDMPSADPAFAEILAAYRTLAQSLLRHQDESGMWRQVIDFPGSYRELSATCIIGFSLLRGIARGWLDAKSVQPAVDRAWSAVKHRTASDGALIDVCESTGAQATLRDYLRRKAILGRDARGGAMVLLFATELAFR